MKKITYLVVSSKAQLLLVSHLIQEAGIELKKKRQVIDVNYQDGKILRFNNGHEVDIRIWICQKPENRVDSQSQWSRSDCINFQVERTVYDGCREGVT